MAKPRWPGRSRAVQTLCTDVRRFLHLINAAEVLGIRNCNQFPAAGNTTSRKLNFKALLFCEPLADRLQFTPAHCARFWISHFKSFERIEYNLRYNQPSVFLVIGGNDIPGRVPGACRTEVFLIRLHVLLPEFSLLNIRKAEFTVLFRHIDALKKTLSLFLLREVEEKLDDAGSVTVEVSLHIHDGTIPVVPNRFVGVRRVRDPFAAKNFGMHADDQYLLIVGSVEDTDPPALR